MTTAPTDHDPAPGQAFGRPPRVVRKAYRDTTAPVLGGVAAGLARHLGWPVLWVRVGFLVLVSVGGLGVVLYGAYWVVLPAAPHFVDAPPGVASATRQGRRPWVRGRLGDAGQAVALGALGIGVVLLLGAFFGDIPLLVPLGLGVLGVALLWRQADESQRSRWLDSSGRISLLRVVFGTGGWQSYARVAAGLGLVVVALVLLTLRSGGVAAARDLTLLGLVGLAGVAVVLGPWVYRLAADLASDLTEEREERVRTQERADVAAHLHDSVLQTLALIQNNAGDPAAVSRLARAQERDLRSWLYVGDSDVDGRLAGALREVGADAEDSYGVPVEVVVVGDCDLDDALRATVAASREAVVNAVRHSGAARVDVYAEVGEAAVEVFVRDTGRGFDLDRVAGDRHGVRGSIIERVERRGGTATVRSEAGQGTEVRLRVPRTKDRAEETA